MIANEIINKAVSPLQPADSIYDALAVMEVLQCGHLPVVDQQKFLGFLPKDAMATMMSQRVSDFVLVGVSCTVTTEDHFYDVFKATQQHSLSMAAVLDHAGQYRGVIMAHDAVAAAAHFITTQTKGAVLVLSINALDYSLTEIARLVEENNAKIISLVAAEDETDDRKMRLTLKVNQTELTHIVATLERFGYNVVGKYHAETELTEGHNERIDMLMRYINI